MKDLGLFALRLVFGGLIALHGYPKLFGAAEVRPAGDHSLLLGEVEAARTGSGPPLLYFRREFTSTSAA